MQCSVFQLVVTSVIDWKQHLCRYASLLEATMEHAPSVTAIEPAELMEFCAEAGYTYRLESHGSLLIPPDYNVGMTDWERSMRLRCVALEVAAGM